MLKLIIINWLKYYYLNMLIILRLYLFETSHSSFFGNCILIFLCTITMRDELIGIKKTHIIAIQKNYAICNMQLHILFEQCIFLHQLIHFINLYIKILR